MSKFFREEIYICIGLAYATAATTYIFFVEPAPPIFKCSEISRSSNIHHGQVKDQTRIVETQTPIAVAYYQPRDGYEKEKTPTPREKPLYEKPEIKKPEMKRERPKASGCIKRWYWNKKKQRRMFKCV